MLDAAHDPYPHTSLVYPGTGHGVVSAVPGLPTLGPVVDSRYGTLTLGGTRPPTPGGSRTRGRAS